MTKSSSCKKTGLLRLIRPQSFDGMHATNAVDVAMAFDYTALYNLYRTKNMKSQDEIIGMRQLSDFQADHSPPVTGYVLFSPPDLKLLRLMRCCSWVYSG